MSCIGEKLPVTGDTEKPEMRWKIEFAVLKI